MPALTTTVQSTSCLDPQVLLCWWGQPTAHTSASPLELRWTIAAVEVPIAALKMKLDVAPHQEWWR